MNLTIADTNMAYKIKIKLFSAKVDLIYQKKSSQL